MSVKPPSIHTTQEKVISPLSHTEYLPLLFLAVAIVFFPLGVTSESSRTLSLVFVSIILEAIPFMLVGSLIGGLIEAFISRDKLLSVLPRRRWQTICVAAAAGIIFPVCECAIVPVMKRLLGKGLPFPAAIAYLLGGPIVNPVVALSTGLAYTFTWKMVLLRLGCGYLIAIAVSLVVDLLCKNAPCLETQAPPLPMVDEHSEHKHHHSHDHEHDHEHDHGHDAPLCNCCSCMHDEPRTFSQKIGAAITHAREDFLSVGYYLIIGSFIAALAQTFIDRSIFLKLSTSPLLAIVSMMILAILLNLCSEADAFIAASFRGLIPASAQLAFLLVGPMFDIKLLLMYQSVFKRRTIIILSICILIAVFLVSVGCALLGIAS